MRITVCFALLFILIVSAFAETGSPTSSLDTAKTLISQGKQKDAIPILDKIAASDPESAPQALLMMGDCYDALEDWGKARECLEQLLTLYPNVVAPDGDIKRRMMDYYLADGKFEEYRDLRQELASEYQSDAWKLYYTVGRRRVLRHEYAEAIPELKKTIELGIVSKNSREIIDANYRLLHCYVVQKQWADAEDVGPILIKEYPAEGYKFQMEMGKCYQVRKDFEKAIGYLEPAAKACPKGFDNGLRLYKTLLDCYDRSNKLDKATDLAKKLVDDYPNEPGYKWELGRCYVYAKEYEKAAPLFEKVIEMSKAEWEIRSSEIFLGQCLSNLGNGDEALERIEAYYRGKPDQWDSCLLAKAAVLFYGPKDYQRCVDNLKKLLDQVAAGRKSDLVPTARELICKSYEKLGKWAELASLLEEIARESGSVTLLCQASMYYFEADNYGEAERLCKEVMKNANVPDNLRAECMYRLALCHWENGLKDAARLLMQRVCDRYAGTVTAQKARGWLYLWSQHDN